jgi:hypothetical protein
MLVVALVFAGSAVVLYLLLVNPVFSPLSDFKEGAVVSMPTNTDQLPSIPMPYRRLESRRDVGSSDFPEDLRKFYAWHEGTGLDSDPERIVRLCKLAEVKTIRWADLHIFGKDKPDRGWEHFAGYRIGISSFHDEIIYVLQAPVCAAGSILALGPDVAGPGGKGPLAIEPSLVLAPNFAEWIKNLERAEGHEYGLTPGSIRELPKLQKDRLLHYYKGLNPGLRWEGS